MTIHIGITTALWAAIAIGAAMMLGAMALGLRRLWRDAAANRAEWLHTRRQQRHIHVRWVWRDCWIGFYVAEQTIYVAPVPFVVIEFPRAERRPAPVLKPRSH